MARRPAPDELRSYEEAKQLRQPHENDFRLASAYCLPRHYAAWASSDGPAAVGTSGQQVRRINFDSTGTLALPKYMAVLERIATPHGTRWHTLQTSDTSLLRSYRVRGFFDQLTDKLFQMRYQPKANFRQSSSEVYASMGAYGTGPIFMGKRKKSPTNLNPSFLYRACALRDIFILLNSEGEVEAVYRRVFRNYRQFVADFPGVTPPKAFEADSKNPSIAKEEHRVEFVHVCRPRSDYAPDALDKRRLPIVASWICVPDKAYVDEEEGFLSQPYLTPRTFTEAGDPYGYSPAMQCLAAMGSASAIKKSVLKQGQKAADPVLLTHDDGVMNGRVDLRPGSQNPGGLDKQGRELVKVLQTGNFTVSDKLLQDERADVNDSFFVTLFQILTETPEMTATEVMERIAEKSALISPTMGRLQSEFLGPCIAREIEVLTEMGLMPEVPQELIEAEGQYDIIYTSPMAKSMYAEEVSGFMRAVEFSTQLVQQTQDPSHLDHFDFETAIPEIASRMAVPVRWMTTDEKKQALAQTRGQQQQQQMLLQHAAPIAGALKTAASMQQGGA